MIKGAQTNNLNKHMEVERGQLSREGDKRRALLGGCVACIGILVVVTMSFFSGAFFFWARANVLGLCI